MAVVGVISDTHGLLRQQACDALQGVDVIVHGGDIGSLEVIERLERIAPVIAVRGNIDKDDWALRFPLTNRAIVEGRHIYLLHNIQQLDIDPADEGYHVVIFGHSHKPAIYEQHGVIYLNPGSAGRRRFKLPISVARIQVTAAKVAAEIVELAV